MTKIFKEIDITDVFLIAGLAGLGFGLNEWFGLGQALTVIGATMLILSILWGYKK